MSITTAITKYVLYPTGHQAVCTGPPKLVLREAAEQKCKSAGFKSRPIPEDSGKVLSPGRAADLRDIRNRAGAWQTPEVTAVLLYTLMVLTGDGQSSCTPTNPPQRRPSLAVQAAQAREWEAAGRQPEGPLSRGTGPHTSSNIFSVRVGHRAEATTSRWLLQGSGMR